MRWNILIATFFLSTSGWNAPLQSTHIESTKKEITNVLETPYWPNVINEYSPDTLQLSHYSFARSTSPEEKNVITQILDNLKPGKLKSKVAEDGSALIFYENWIEQFMLFPNIEYWLDDQNNPIMISKIADSNRDEVIIGLSLDKIKKANISHCLYDWYDGSENYATQLTKYSTRDIKNLLKQLRGWCSVTPKQ